MWGTGGSGGNCGRGFSKSRLSQKKRKTWKRRRTGKGEGKEKGESSSQHAALPGTTALAYYPVCDKELADYTPCEDPAFARKFPRDMLMHQERHCPPRPDPTESIGLPTGQPVGQLQPQPQHLAQDGAGLQAEEGQQLHQQERQQHQGQGQQQRGQLRRCLIPPPPGYRVPPPWPQSRDEAWFENVPQDYLVQYKKDQNWVVLDREEGKFRFPGGGTMFKSGAEKYIRDLAELIPLSTGEIRTALDTGCGVGSFGAHLLSWEVMTLSMAPRDEHRAQVQFALERGVPAMLGVLATKRLPFPARAFDMAHCSRCLIPWFKHDGLYLTEIDRLLRPGGYWVLTGPPIHWSRFAKGWGRTKQDLKEEQDKIEAAAARLCWVKVVEKEIFAVWQKPEGGPTCLNQEEGRADGRAATICRKGVPGPDTAWYTRLENCVSPMLPVPADGTAMPGGQLTPWPQRLDAIPPRIKQAESAAAAAGEVAAEMGGAMTSQGFAEDTQMWRQRLADYKTRIEPPGSSSSGTASTGSGHGEVESAGWGPGAGLASKGRYRNVMDMNAGMGGFAAALVAAADPVWVMNVVPVDAPNNTLGIVFERGLLGVYHNWCEAFSTYPRTYDLLHAAGVFSLIAQTRCTAEDVLLEMDRILRPGGGVIIRDIPAVLGDVQPIAEAMRWEVKRDVLEQGDEHLLLCQKKVWTG